MSDPVASALLIVAAIAYLGGAVVVVAALAKVLATWPQGWRTRRAAEPADQALQQRAAAAMAAVVFAQVALTGLSCAAVESLAAHELLTAPTGVT